MTTGRINQVTILTLKPGGNNVNPRRSRAVTERRKELESLTAVRRTLEQGYTGLSHYPFAPTEFPTRRSATQESELEVYTQCNIHPAGGGYHSRVTSKDGYPIRLAPECLRNRFDHRSLIHRLQQSLPAS